MNETFIAGRLARLRTEMGVSARDMSLSIGQANNYINTIESGKAFPSVKGLFYIFEYLNISPKDFFDDGNANPAKLNELIDEAKQLDSETLEQVIGIVRKMRGAK